ncbi:MAG TPA: hypothetical protein VEB41_13415 [Burkholderiales bacterium]|nr:hypothetical protein [Burkholderiales bacterium]
MLNNSGRCQPSSLPRTRRGTFANKGSDYRPKGLPRHTEVRNFKKAELGKVVPYGVYDIADNSGWVGAGIASDTAQTGGRVRLAWKRACADSQTRDTPFLTQPKAA